MSASCRLAVLLPSSEDLMGGFFTNTAFPKVGRLLRPCRAHQTSCSSAPLGSGPVSLTATDRAQIPGLARSFMGHCLDPLHTFLMALFIGCT
jgi:hypothetical protein